MDWIVPHTEVDRLRLQADLVELEEAPLKSDWKIFAIMLLVAVVCLGVVMPYRSINLPRILLFGWGLCFMLFQIPLLMHNHEYIILILLTFLPFSKVLPGTFGRLATAFNATNILLMLSITGWLIRQGMQHRPLYQRTKADFPVLLFLFLSVLSFINGFILAENRSVVEVFFAWKRWATPMLVFFIVAGSLRSLRWGVLVYLSFTLTTGLIGFLGMKKFYLDQGMRSSIDKMRLVATSGPNHLGFLMCSCVFLLLVLWWSQRKWKIAWFLWIPILSCIQTMRLTYSRGGQVGFLAGFLAFAFFVNKKFFAVCVALGIFLFFNPSYIPQRLGGRLRTTVVGDEGNFTERLDKSSQQRLDVWSGGFRMALAHPFMGVGYHNFPRKVGAYNRKAAGRDAHNTYLIVAAEMGLPALVIFLWFFWVAWRSGLYVLKHAGDDKYLRIIGMGYVCMLTAAMVSNMFGTRFDSIEVTVQIYALTAVILNCEKLIRTRKALGVDEGGVSTPVDLPVADVPLAQTVPSPAQQGFRLHD